MSSALDPALLALVDRWAGGLRSASHRSRREWLLADRSRRTYLRLCRGRGYELWLIRWPEGSMAPLHDHGGAAGAAAVIEGELRERIYHPGPAPYWELRRWTSRTITAFGPDHVHEVFNEADRPAYSLHLYAPGLDSMSFFAPGSSGLLEAYRSETRGHWS